MKKRFTKIMAALALLVFMAPSMVAVGQTRDEVVAYTLEPVATGSNSTPHNSYTAEATVTIDNIEWAVTGNSYMVPWRIGGKSITGVDRTLYSNTAISDNISKIEVTHGAASSITVNSWTVIVSKNSDFSNPVSTLTPTFAANSTTTITRPDGADWSNCYYKFVYNVTVSGTSNKFIEFTRAKFYKETGNVVSDSDLTITNASTDLTFDLYNNATPQVITYTTSSTGAITITPSTSDYFTYEHDATAKTITVTPTAVTSSAQTVTISQVADDNYNAGSVSFTVSVEDSTPISSGDVTFDATIDKGTSPLVKSGVTFECTNGTLNNGTEYRLFKNSITTFSVSEGTITQIAFTGTSSNPASGFETQTGWTTNGYNGTWTGNAQEVSFTASGAQVRATLIVVTVSASGTPDPSIEAEDVSLAYDATSGQITYTLNDQGTTGTVSASVPSGSWITLPQSSTSPINFTCTANPNTEARSETVSLTYTYGSNETIIKNVTVTQAAAPVIYTTIPDIFNAATSSSTNVNVTFGNWVVSGVNGSNVYVTDNIGNGFIIYKSSHGFGVNDKLSGTVYETPLKKYNGSAEFTNLTTTTTGLSVSNDGEITVITNKTIADLGGINTGAVITLNNLTYDGTNLSDGTNTIKPYNSLYSDMSFESGKTYNVTGVYLQFNTTTKEILPRGAADIVEVVSSTPVINAENVSITSDATSGAITYTITNEASDGVLTANTTSSWLTLGTVGATVPFTCSANTASTARTATVTLTYTYNTNETVNKEVTVTQAAYVPAPTGDPYVRISNLNQLTDGSIVVIASRYNATATNYYAMNSTIGNKMDVTEFVSQASGSLEILPSTIVNSINSYYWVVSVDNDTYTFTNASGNKIGYGSSTNFAANSNTAWTIARATSGAALVPSYEGFTITNVSTDTRGIALKNDANPVVFGAYATSNANGDAYNFFLDFFVQTPGIDLFVSGYNISTISNGGYHLIASPIVGSVSPTDVTNMIDATAANYDLYRFNQDETVEWQNYKGHPSGFVIESGKGYLYAHNTDVTLTFNGTAYSGDGTFALTQSATNTSNGGKMNVLGNPFNATANIGNRSYYKMNEAGSELVSVVGGTIGALEGIMVEYNAEKPSVTFTTSKSRDVIELLTLNLKKQDNDIDRVIVRFDGGDQLHKYQIFGGSKVYVPLDNQNYAIVNGNNQGTLPVNFKATANGTYTLNIDTENVTFSTLILHDNLTDTDINLLAKATYSFEATTSDEETRFTLTYSKDGEGVALPYSYGFETNLVEEGWTAITNISNSGVSTGEESHSGTHFFRFHYDENPAAYLVTPLLTGTENGVAVSFYYRSYMESWPDSFKVGYSTDETVTDPSEFTYGPLIEDAPEEWTLYEGFLPVGTKYMAIQYVYSDGYYLYLDDFSFVEPDACPKPGSLNVANVTDNAATLTWTGNSDSYNVKLGCATNITSLGSYNFEDETIDAAFDNDTEYPWVIWNENPNDGSYCIASGNYGEHSTTSSISMTVNFEKTGIIEFFSRAESESIYYDYGFFSIDGELQFMEGGETSFNWQKHRFEVEPGTHVFTWSYLKDYSMSGHADRFFIDDIQIKSADYTWNTYTTSTTTYAFEGLTPDTDYKVLVQGICGDETSIESEPLAFTTIVIPTFEKTIEAYTDNSGYYLIASPVGNDLGLTPATEVTNLVDGSFDLYMFDQTGDDDGKQWLNYKANAFSLEMGFGYLYANSETVTLTFKGTPNDPEEDFMVEVIYDGTSEFAGLNLLGNPFAVEAYLVDYAGNSLAYHRLDPTTNTYITVDDDSAIEAMEGIFYETSDNDMVYFSTALPTVSKSNLNITVSQGRGMIDNAIIRFGEGNTLKKMSLLGNNTKVYIPQDGKEYALVNADAFGEMPVNFKVESNGTYTMGFSNQNVEFSYLHLIDNLTGNDVDLLANPSYTFNANTSDYASRFRLVFAAGNNSESSDFAYVSDGNIIVNGEGTLQVIDMMGRIVITEQINGVSSIKLNAAAGVYVLQLNDKTQKIVVK